LDRPAIDQHRQATTATMTRPPATEPITMPAIAPPDSPLPPLLDTPAGPLAPAADDELDPTTTTPPVLLLGLTCPAEDEIGEGKEEEEVAATLPPVDEEDVAVNGGVQVADVEMVM